VVAYAAQALGGLCRRIVDVVDHPVLGDGMPVLTSDEPAPLSPGTGPSPVQLYVLLWATA
jgi:hypothetical protein